MSRQKLSNNATYKLVELSFAVPQVLFQRLSWLAFSGPVLRRAEQKELYLMVAEKQHAFSRSWLDMGIEVMRLQQRLLLSCFTGQLPASALSLEPILLKGISPIHRRAVSNSRRLARRRRS